MAVLLPFGTAAGNRKAPRTTAVLTSVIPPMLARNVDTPGATRVLDVRKPLLNTATRELALYTLAASTCGGVGMLMMGLGNEVQ